MSPSSLTVGILRVPHPEDLNMDLLADALFPPVEINEQEDVDDDSDTPDHIDLPPPLLREPRSHLMRRVKDRLEPQIESCVPRNAVRYFVCGWHSCA